MRDGESGVEATRFPTASPNESQSWQQWARLVWDMDPTYTDEEIRARLCAAFDRVEEQRDAVLDALKQVQCVVCNRYHIEWPAPEPCSFCAGARAAIAKAEQGR